MPPEQMYNPGLFFPRQESKMPAKKVASKKRKKTTKTARKKVAARKTVSRKKVAKKKAVSRKKAPVRKKTASKKKVAKKKVSRKKVAKKVAKKKAARKKVSRKKVAKKKAVKKTVARKKVTKKAVSKKKASKKKTSSKKRPVVKKKVPAGRPAARKLPARKSTSRSRGDMLSGPIHGIEPYKPKRGEEYMSDEQLDHFRNILNAWKRELMYEVDRTVHHMQDEAANFPDPNDRATQESEFGLELRTRDRERKLLRKIDSALARIDEGSYGYCDETGEEIGLKRLEARPVATLCLEAQERRELAERQFRDRDDRYR
jgi:DnaK suppressor protein